jgi:hypothetical protein
LKEFALISRLAVPVLVQFFAAVFVASAVGLSIGFLYPIERELDIAMYTSGDVQLNVPFPNDPNHKVESQFRKSGIGFHKASSAILAINGAQESLGPIEAYIVQSPGETSLPFPSDAIVDTKQLDKSHPYVDISADIAKKTGTEPGQLIQLNWGELGTQEIPVRAIYAVRETGFLGVISISQSFLPKTFSALGKTPTMALVTAHSAKTAAVLLKPEVQEIYKADGYQVPVQYSSKLSQLNLATSQSRASLGLILAVSILAGGALLGVILRETGNLMSSLRNVAMPLARIGVSASDIRRIFKYLAIFLGGIAACSGALLCGWLYQSRALSSAFPRTMHFPLMASTLAIVVLIVLATNSMYSTKDRKTRS